jgi:CheY-like chemotaxis protein
MAEGKPIEETAAPGAQRPFKILLVEDNEDNRLLIRAFLKSTPHQVQMAENGAVGIEMFKKANYDIVFMDMQMPVMDGYTATREIRRWEREKKRPAVPVIALTAYALKEDEEKSMNAGCDGHLTKPIKKQEILAALQSIAGKPSSG